MTNQSVLLRIQDLSKTYGSHKVLNRVSLDIQKSSLNIVAGPDGAGKSTLFKSIIGLVRKDEGTILYKGKIVEKDFSPINSECGYMPERFSLYPDLTVEENLNFFADIYQVGRNRKEEMKQRLLERTGMRAFSKRRAGLLSGGMKQKLALSAILLSSPELIILDEPTTGVDPMSRIEFYDIIDELRGEGKTIIISTPYLHEAEKGDHIFFIQNGSILRQGKIREIKSGFPAKVYRILPLKGVFEAIKDLEHLPEFKHNLFIRGRHLQYLETGEPELKDRIPAAEIKEVTPSLEDIYLYYERTGHASLG